MATTNDFVLKTGDTYPPVIAQLLQFNNTTNLYAPVDLTGATVHFRMSVTGAGNLLLDAAAVIVDAATGIVRYDWAIDGSDTGVKGDYQAEWRVTFSDGRIATFPRGQTPDFNTIHIEDPVT
jgi:hypothetical protein